MVSGTGPKHRLRELNLAVFLGRRAPNELPLAKERPGRQATPFSTMHQERQPVLSPRVTVIQPCP
jgi:hypothetical protein